MMTTDADRVAFALGAELTLHTSDGRPIRVRRNGTKVQRLGFGGMWLSYNPAEVRAYAKLYPEQIFWYDFAALLPQEGGE